jgi:hypothetical protein
MPIFTLKDLGAKSTKAKPLARGRRLADVTDKVMLTRFGLVRTFLRTPR